MNRRILALFLMLTTLVGISVLAQAPANRAAIEKQILASERVINEAFAKGDVKAFHANLGADAVGIDPGGVMKVNTPEFDKMMQSVKVQTWNIDSSQFYWINDNAIVHIYRWTGRGAYQGQPLPSPTWSSTVWANRGGKWLATFHQETQAMPAPPPAAGKK